MDILLHDIKGELTREGRGDASRALEVDRVSRENSSIMPASYVVS